MTLEPNVTLPAGADPSRDAAARRGRFVAGLYALVLGGLLVGYMFLGRGFAHIAIGPIYVGDVVLIVGVLAAAYVAVRAGLRPPIGWTIGLLVAFAAIGALRTFPFFGTYGIAALRDGVLWAYAAFALTVYVVADRRLVLGAFRAYGWMVPIFALWLPICWTLFRILSADIDPQRPGSLIPLVFFKGGDMAIHVVGAIAFLVVGAGAILSVRTFLWRTAVFLPLLWTIFVAGTSNRGALVTAILGIVAVAVLAPRSRNWLPFLAALVLGAVALVVQMTLAAGWLTSAQPAEPTPTPSISVAPSASQRPSVEPTSPEDHAVTLPNGSFEAGPVGSGVIEDWEVGPLGSYDVVEGDAHDGTQFVSMQNVGAAHEATLTSSSFRFDASQDIAVSFWVKAIVGEPRLEVYVNWYDRSGDLISSGVVGAVSTDGARTWQAGSGANAPPADSTRAQVLIYEATGGATVGLDNVTIHAGNFIGAPVEPISPEDLPTTLPNGSFEAGPVGIGVIEDWESGPVGSYNVVEGDAHDGTKFASVQNAGDAYEATLTSSSFRFDAGQDIAVSWWVKAIAGESRLEVFVNWHDRSGEMISSDPVGAIDSAETWQAGFGALAPPVDATHARILIYEAIGEATVGLDQVTIRAGDFIADPVVPEGRPATLEQMIENLLSVFGPSSDPGLSGTREFRLAWWGTIVDYTLFGDYFWAGKGFGINLADDDGFQSTADGSLRAPHNSHMTVLARMGVPAFVLWLGLQAAFAVGLLRATLAFRRAGDLQLASIGAWVLVYWFAMAVNTSFDPYLEGPQGGIWFWSVFGLGLVVMRLRRRLTA